MRKDTKTVIRDAVEIEATRLEAADMDAPKKMQATAGIESQAKTETEVSFQVS